MPTLIVMRHAEAEAAPGMRDADRPLTTNGRLDAIAAGHFLQDFDRPDLVLCSVAERAGRTAALVAREFEPALEVEGERRIYGNDVEDLLDLLRERGGDHKTLLLVGHNPSAYQLVSLVADGGEEGFPPAAIAVIQLDCAWSEMGQGTGRLITQRR